MPRQLQLCDLDNIEIDYRKILTKYNIEPRGDYRGSTAWLVVFDLENNRYLTDGSRYRRYLKFQTSQDAIKYLIENEYPGTHLEWRSII